MADRGDKEHRDPRISEGTRMPERAPLRDARLMSMAVSAHPNLTAVELSLLRPGTALGVSTYVKTSSGYSTITASNGLSALEVFKTTKVDVLFTEIVMPSMSGAELSSRVRRTRPDLPVVIASRYRNLLEDDLKRQIHAAAHVDKPFSPAAVRSAVKTATTVQ